MKESDDQSNDKYLGEFEFIKIYDQYNDKIFRHLYFRFHDREQALDLMQETFMKTFSYVKENGPLENIQAFLYRVATNLAIDQFKKRKAYSLEQMEEDSGFEPSIDSTIETKNKIDAEKVLELIGKIPTNYQTVIVMRYVDDLSIKNISTIIGESENATSVKIHRGLNHIRKLIKNYEQ